jgi:hypothetical protein
VKGQWAQPHDKKEGRGGGERESCGLVCKDYAAWLSAAHSLSRDMCQNLLNNFEEPRRRVCSHEPASFRLPSAFASGTMRNSKTAAVLHAGMLCGPTILLDVHLFAILSAAP